MPRPPPKSIVLYDANGRATGPVLTPTPTERLSEEDRRDVRRMPPARELPIHTLADVSQVGWVKQALLKMEREGDFRDAAMLVDAMGRDDRIAGCLRTLVDGVLSLPFTMEPADMEKATQKQKAIAETALADFQMGIPLDVKREVVKWGQTLGIGLASVAPYTKGPKRWAPKAKVWHPQFIRWDWTKRCYVVLTEDQAEVDVNPNSGQWWIYTPFGYERGWMSGLVRGLAIPFLCRQWGNRDSARYMEVHGAPTRVGKAPQSATPEEKAEFARELASLASESTIIIPQVEGAVDGSNFDVDLLEASGRSEQVFDAFLSRQDRNVAILILGQNLTTEVQGGSFAAAEVHKLIRADIIQAVAWSVDESLYLYVSRPYVDVNYGTYDVAPWPTHDTEPPEDKAAAADLLGKVGSAIKTLTDAGVDVDVVRIANRFDIPLREPEEGEEQKKQGPAGQIYAYHLQYKLLRRNEVRRRLGEAEIPGEFGEEFIGGDGSDAESPGGLEKPIAKPRKNGGKGAVGDGGAALMNLFSQDGGTDATDGYLDELTTEASRQALAALEPAIAKIRAILQQDIPREEMAKKLTALFPDLDAARLEDLLYSVSMMTELAGRLDAQREAES